MRMNKKALDFNFGWIFTIIVGAAILFLAIYSASQLVRTNRNIQDTEIGKQIGILLSPVEASIESETSPAPIVFNTEARIYNDCDAVGNFGSQEIGIATKSGIGSAWEKPGTASTFYNKYLFSSNIAEGNKFFLFSKSFEMPFRIGNLIFMWSNKEEYCFVNAPNDVKEVIESINAAGYKNLNISEDGKCKLGTKEVCFSGSCDIVVDINSGTVRKEKKVLYYQGSLLYGAIFASPEIYECQVKRLMKRASELALLYNDKTQSLASAGCNSNLGSELVFYANNTFSFNSSLQLRTLGSLSEELEGRNKLLSCKLW